MIYVHMANIILLCCDSYLDHLNPGVKLDTFEALGNAPSPQIGALFPDNVLRHTEDEIC